MAEPTSLNILGADLSLRSSGLVLLSPKNKVLWSGLIKPPPKLRDVKRLKWLMKELQTTLRALTRKFGPMQAAIEGTAYDTPSMIVTILLAEWAVCARLVLDSEEIPVQSVPVKTCRKWLCGRGDVDKLHVANRIKIDYGISFDNDSGYDQSDASLIALWANRIK